MPKLTTSTKVMTASTADYEFLKSLKGPQLLSFKIDGVRGINEGGVIYSRTGKAFPNKYLQEKFANAVDLDFEIVHGNPTDDNLCDITRGMCNSFSQPVDRTKLFVFDRLGKDAIAFKSRHALASNMLKKLNDSDINIVQQFEMEGLEAILEFEEWALSLGYEGIMGRRPLSPYKHGRSTAAEGFLWKLKRFTDEEVQICGFIEETRNDNPLVTNSQGYAERSTHKANMVPTNTLGKFKAIWRDQEIVVSCGKLSHEQRKFIWLHQDLFMHQWFTMRFFGYGMRSLPRQGRFVHFRDPYDETLHVSAGV